ncbi:MAG: hypothetical protein V3S64_13395 [bacterium]
MGSRAGELLVALVSVVLMAAILTAMVGGAAWASPTDVVRVEFVRSGGNRWRVSVTLRHADTGWKHYANLWVVENLGGKELGRRELVHPHEDEQPFTRSLTLTLPHGVIKVRIRAGDNVGGMDSNTVLVDLTRSSGERYVVR